MSPSDSPETVCQLPSNIEDEDLRGVGLRTLTVSSEGLKLHFPLRVIAVSNEDLVNERKLKEKDPAPGSTVSTSYTFYGLHALTQTIELVMVPGYALNGLPFVVDGGTPVRGYQREARKINIRPPMVQGASASYRQIAFRNWAGLLVTGGGRFEIYQRPQGPELTELVASTIDEWQNDNEVAISARKEIEHQFQRNAALLMELVERHRKQWHQDNLTRALVREYLYDLRDRGLPLIAMSNLHLPYKLGFAANDTPMAAAIDRSRVLSFPVLDFLKGFIATLRNDVGYLTILSEPIGYQTWINDRPRGSTKVQRVLSVGDYQVKVGPGRDSVVCSEKVSIAANETAPVICKH